MSKIVSDAMPEPRHLELTEQVEAILRDHNGYETAEEVQLKSQVVEEVRALAKRFVKEVTANQGKSMDDVENAGGRIFVTGSALFGTSAKGGDVDIVLLAPRNVSHDDFFEVMPRILNELGPAVQKLKCVQGARVPIITLELRGVELDILFSKCSAASVSDSFDVRNDEVLRNLDEKSIGSLNSVRMNNMVVELVPQHNLGAWRTVVRFMKLWAKARGVYSNKMGYPGGIAWAILCARIVQLYPNAAAAFLISRFFQFYKLWRWPNPVILCPISEGPPDLRNLQVWNVRNQADSLHTLPIITPAFPSINTTSNCPQSNADVVKAEFARGAEITKGILEGTGPTWADLLEPSDFFSRYSTYLEVLVTCGTDAADADMWLGFIEAKIIGLIQLLQNLNGVDAAPAFHTMMVDPQAPAGTGSFFLAIVPTKPQVVPAAQASVKPPVRIDLGGPTDAWMRKVMLNERRKEGMAVDFRVLPRKELPDWVYPGGKRPRKRKREKGDDAGAAGAGGEKRESKEE